ncbi:MAG: hypothetical protein H7Y37_05930 [Anaerolineae bacterium]|nr:hypothetical protein [Gloeobacterales cyanobacterium ES-bin-313]
MSRVGILPPGALGVSFFYHLSDLGRSIDGQVTMLERRGSASSSTLRSQESFQIAKGSEILALPTATILQGDLLSCQAQGTLPEVLLVCPNPDQLLEVVTDLVELIVRGGVEDLPIVVFSANGIYFQRLRQAFIEKLEEATLFGRLSDLWPEPMGKIVGRLLRGVTMQTGLREGSGASTLYRPGPRGLTRIAGGDLESRQRALAILTGRGGWYELAEDCSPTRIEFDKALVNLSSNLMGLLLAIDDQGHFQRLSLASIFQPQHLPRVRELAFHLNAVGKAVRAYSEDDDVELLISQLVESSRLHQTHIPSSLQWVGMMLDLGKLEAKMPPTETWLVDPLLFYAEAAQLDDAVQYFRTLRDTLIQKLQLAIQAKEMANDRGAK